MDAIENLLPCENCGMNDIDNVEFVEKADVPILTSDESSRGRVTRMMSPSGDGYYICGECDTVLNEFE